MWQNVGDGKCSSEGKGPQKTGGQGRSEGKGPHSFWIGPCPHVLAWASPWVKCGLEDTTSRPKQFFIDKIDSNFLHNIFLVLYTMISCYVFFKAIYI